MKVRIIAFSLLAAILLTGCGGGSLTQKAKAAEDAIENRVDAVEDRIEQAVTPSPSTVSQAKLSAEEAEAIALKDAGVTADQVTRLYSEFDVDHGISEYDVDFHHGGWEYDYEIHAETGEILFKDIERDD